MSRRSTREADGPKNAAAALERAPTQDLVEVEEADVLAFDAIEPSELNAQSQAFGAGGTIETLRCVPGGGLPL